MVCCTMVYSTNRAAMKSDNTHVWGTIRIPEVNVTMGGNFWHMNWFATCNRRKAGKKQH